MEGQLNLSTQKTLQNIVLYFLLFLAGDFINSLVWDLFFSVVELPYRELYSILRMTGQLFFTCLFFWIYTVKVLRLKMRSFGISFEIKPWGVLFSLLLPASVILAFLFIGQSSTNSFAVNETILIVISSILTALKAGIIEEMLFRGFIMKLLENLRKGQVFQRSGPVLWQCRNCGHLEWGKGAPAACPICGAPRGFFQIRAENY